MGIIKDVFNRLSRTFGTPLDINHEDYVPPGGNIDDTPYVRTAYSQAVKPDAKDRTFIMPGDIKDYHLKRSCR